MADLAYRSRGFQEKLAKFCETAIVPQSIIDAVAKILEEVRQKGDAGISSTLKRIDCVSLKSEEFRISKEEMDSAAKRLAKGDLDAIKESIQSVTAFHRHALPKSWTAKNNHGATIGERFYPIDRQ